MASEPNYFVGSNNITVVKQHDLALREFSFGSVLLFGAGCQQVEPSALAPCCTWSSIRRRITCVSAWPRVFLRSSSFLGGPAELARAASGLLIGVDGLCWPGRAGRRQMIRQVWVRASNTMSPRRSNSRSQPVIGHHPHRRWKMAALRTMSVRCCTGGSGLGWY